MGLTEQNPATAATARKQINDVTLDGWSTSKNVDDDADPDGNGTSWATAYDSLQDALDEACSPSGPTYEIRIAQDTYKPSQVDFVTQGCDAQTIESIDQMGFPGRTSCVNMNS